MRKLVIVATKYSNTKDAMEVFERRNWRPMRDESTIPKIKRVVNKGKHSTPLINLEWEETEYGEE
jgi:ubiquinone biosynthesis protein Coq4